MVFDGITVEEVGREVVPVGGLLEPRDSRSSAPVLSSLLEL